MAQLEKKVFWQFVVSLPEDGNVAGMRELLQEHVEHTQELLTGEREGVEQGNYSAINYSTWLCQFEKYKPAQAVVQWLVEEQGIPSSIWTALALEDELAFRSALSKDASLADARHPMFQDNILEMASEPFRNILIEYGADVGNIKARVTLGDVEGARKLIEDGQFTVDQGKATRDLLTHAFCQQQDEFACYLLDKGGPHTGNDELGYSPIMLASIWGCVEALQKLIERGVDVESPVLGESVLTWTVHRPSKNVVEVFDLLVQAGVPIPSGKFEGQTIKQVATARGLDEIVARLARLDE